MAKSVSLVERPSNREAIVEKIRKIKSLYGRIDKKRENARRLFERKSEKIVALDAEKDRESQFLLDQMFEVTTLLGYEYIVASTPKVFHELEKSKKCTFHQLWNLPGAYTEEGISEEEFLLKYKTSDEMWTLVNQDAKEYSRREKENDYNIVKTVLQPIYGPDTKNK